VAFYPYPFLPPWVGSRMQHGLDGGQVPLAAFGAGPGCGAARLWGGGQRSCVYSEQGSKLLGELCVGREL